LLVVPEHLRKVTEFANVDLQRRTDIVKKERADPTHVHEVIFEVAHVKHAELEQIALDISDPDSPNYGKHWTRQNIADFVDCYDSQKAIASYMKGQNIEIVEQSPWGDEITAKAPIAVWEQVFSTNFHNFEQHHSKSNTQRKGMVPETVVSGFVRAMQYTLPAEIEEHVEAAFNTVQFTPRSVHGHHVVDLPTTESNLRKSNGLKKTEDALPIKYTDLFQGYITPAVLNQYYGIDSNSGSTLTSQAVYETNGQTMSPESQMLFQINYDLPQQKPSANVGGHVDSAACRPGGGAECSEANANIQYLMGMSQDTPTTYWYDTRGDVRMWINRVSRTANPPDLISMTYICTETDVLSALGSDVVVSSYTTSFDNAAIILALQGTSIVIGTGDDGAVGYNTVYGGQDSCQYNADFPATSPYLTAVGTTVGPENNLPEAACSGISGTISSGGGFSLIYNQPSWQTQAVKDYFNTASKKGVSPEPGYDAGNRAVPDITGAGNVYIVVNGGNYQALAGSSLSAPFVASVISLGNAARRENGLSTFGWLNPLFYKKDSRKIFRDVTSGSNECTSYGHVCCSQGFTAVKGWDPVSGWGSIDFQKFKNKFFNYQYNSGDYLPSRHVEEVEAPREMAAISADEPSTTAGTSANSRTLKLINLK
jgi:tripeptidyl-peptidase-1